MQPIITLTTDFGLKDFSIAILKAALIAEIPHAQIVDIGHHISPFDKQEAAYILKNCYREFPTQTIHIIGVESDIHLEQPLMVMYLNDHIFIGVDNGIMSLIADEKKPDEKYVINLKEIYTENFPEKDLFVRVASHLSKGGSPSIIGKKVNDWKELHQQKPVIKQKDQILGTVIFIDRFGNAVTNITKSLFQQVGKKRKATIKVRNHQFEEIYQRYSGIVKDWNKENIYHGRGLVLFNSANHLEIAIYKSNPQTIGGANTLFGLKKGDEILISFS